MIIKAAKEVEFIRKLVANDSTQAFKFQKWSKSGELEESYVQQHDRIEINLLEKTDNKREK